MRLFNRHNLIKSLREIYAYKYTKIFNKFYMVISASSKDD